MDLERKELNCIPTAQSDLQNKNNEELQNDTSDDDESNDDDDESLDQAKRTLFCANLDERVTEKLLYEAFLQAGPIEKLYIPKDPKGQQRNYGFITYVHNCTVPYALELLQGLTLFRKTLVIKSANTSSLPSLTTQKHTTDVNNANKNNDNDYGGCRKKQRIDDHRQRVTQSDTKDSAYYNSPQKFGEKYDWAKGSSGGRPERLDSHFNFRQATSSTSGSRISGNCNKSFTSNMQERNQHRIQELQQPFVSRENQCQNNYKSRGHSNNYNSPRR